MLITVILLSTVISCSKQEDSLTQVVSTTSGPVRGQVVSFPENKTVLRYLGIPYAKANRFEYPQQTKWTEIFNAVQNGKACPQPNSSFGVQNLEEETNEDCLNLNIFVPKSSTTNLPVIVYIGGLFYCFGKAGTTFNETNVALRGNVIVVSLNYRLGIFGFLSTGSEVIKGNYGLADQIEALNWLQQNIRR
jgi:carboxylesterase type B